MFFKMKSPNQQQQKKILDTHFTQDSNLINYNNSEEESLQGDQKNVDSDSSSD